MSIDPIAVANHQGPHGSDEAAPSFDPFRQLLESAPDAMIVLGTDGRIALVNGQTEVLFGWKRDELVGRTIEMPVPERFRQEHGGSHAAFLSEPFERDRGCCGLRSEARHG
jgi:PAS domain-containing protein